MNARKTEAISHFQLKNGLDVVVIPDRRAPVVTHMIYYRNGAADDPVGKSGIAHFLEHLMFKGTAKNPKGVFSEIVADLGGQVNGKAAPVISGKKGDHLKVFVNGPGKRLWVKSWDGAFSDWTQLQVAIGSGAPGCAIKKSGGDVWCAVVDGGNGPVTAIQISDDEL